MTSLHGPEGSTLSRTASARSAEETPARQNPVKSASQFSGRAVSDSGNTGPTADGARSGANQMRKAKIVRELGAMARNSPNSKGGASAFHILTDRSVYRNGSPDVDRFRAKQYAAQVSKLERLLLKPSYRSFGYSNWEKREIYQLCFDIKDKKLIDTLISKLQAFKRSRQQINSDVFLYIQSKMLAAAKNTKPGNSLILAQNLRQIILKKDKLAAMSKIFDNGESPEKLEEALKFHNDPKFFKDIMISFPKGNTIFILAKLQELDKKRRQPNDIIDMTRLFPDESLDVIVGVLNELPDKMKPSDIKKIAEEFESDSLWEIAKLLNKQSYEVKADDIITIKQGLPEMSLESILGVLKELPNKIDLDDMIKLKKAFPKETLYTIKGFLTWSTEGIQPNDLINIKELFPDESLLSIENALKVRPSLKAEIQYIKDLVALHPDKSLDQIVKILKKNQTATP